MEKPGILYKNHGKTWNFFEFECFNNFDIMNKKDVFLRLKKSLF